jgi:plasmid stabilization system protein ParE
MKIKFTPTFHRNLDEIVSYVYKESKSRSFTIKYIRKLQKHIMTYLTEFPKLGRPADEFGKGIRKLVHQRYSILYRIEEDYILVITIYRENLPSL